eukprot:TRINITY_DN5213_c0_g1_i1.p1 TRINITY_DN5213_c0_g1~~TRINITY_DN5213_c0_g1_i1.p1  ORF type:complete len:493 (+),score=151.20 TRINITY_DN5213_c0_g1_i1:191-1480(+)
MGETELKLKEARENAVLTVAMRGNAQKTTSIIERDTRQTDGVVNDWLKRKVAQTHLLKAKLERTIHALSEEMSLLHQRRAKAADLLRGQRLPLDKAQHRLRSRGTLRPERENIHDPVQDALIAEAADAQRCLDQLQQWCDEMSTTHEQMQLAKVALREDLVDKAAALELDRSCLAVPGDTAEANNHLRRTLTQAVATAASLSADATDAGEVRHLAKSSATHPSQWKRQTTANIDNALVLMRDSVKLRRRVQLYGRQAQQNTAVRGENTCRELEAKIHQTARLASRLQTRLHSIDQELADIARQKDVIQESLADKRTPLHTCARRLALRRKRPAREAVRDDVEVSLQAQLDRLVRNSQSLEKQHEALVGRERELRRLRDELAHDKHDKDQAREIDAALLALDPPSRAATPSLAGSIAGPSPFASVQRASR